MVKYFVLFMILFNTVAKADAFSLFQRSLVQYCVPETANGCTYKATYVEKTNTCSCEGDLLYIDRKCGNVNCPAGTYIVIDNYTNDCPAGSVKL